MALPKAMNKSTIEDLQAVKKYVVARLERYTKDGLDEENFAVMQARHDIKDLDDRIAYLLNKAGK